MNNKSKRSIKKTGRNTRRKSFIKKTDKKKTRGGFIKSAYHKIKNFFLPSQIVTQPEVSNRIAVAEQTVAIKDDLPLPRPKQKNYAEYHNIHSSPTDK